MIAIASPKIGRHEDRVFECLHYGLVGTTADVAEWHQAFRRSDQSARCYDGECSSFEVRYPN